MKKGEIVSKQSSSNVLVLKWQDKRDLPMISTRRLNGSQMPISPLSLIDLVIPDSFKEYEVEPCRFENFLLCDTGPGLNRILIFGRHRGLEV